MTDQEAAALIESIAKPTFNFMMRRVRKEILNNPEYTDLALNQFINILLTASVAHNANLLRWVEAFFKIKTNSEIGFDTLKLSFISRLEEHLKVLKK